MMQQRMQSVMKYKQGISELCLESKKRLARESGMGIGC